MAASLAVSLVLFAGSPAGAQGRIFVYPLNSGGDLGSERRGIPAAGSLQARLAVFLDELLIGPVRLDLAGTAPKGTTLRHAAVLGRTAYIDLSRHMVAPRPLNAHFRRRSGGEYRLQYPIQLSPN